MNDLRIRHAGRIENELGHVPVCGACQQEWPCRCERDARAAKQKSFEDEHTCTHCGKIVYAGTKSRVVRLKRGDALFHAAKSRPCNTAADKLLRWAIDHGQLR